MTAKTPKPPTKPKTAAPAKANGHKELADNDVLVDLDSLAAPEWHFTAKGQRYAYKRWDGFSLLEQRALDKQRARIAELEALEAPTKQQVEEHEIAVRDQLLTLSLMPESKIAELSVEMAGRACLSFFLLLGRQTANVNVAVAAMSGMSLDRLIGALSAPASTTAGTEDSTTG